MGGNASGVFAAPKHIAFSTTNPHPPHSVLNAVLCNLTPLTATSYLGTLALTERDLESVTCPKCRSMWGRWIRGEL